MNIWTQTTLQHTFATWKEAAAAWQQKRLLQDIAVCHWANRELMQVCCLDTSPARANVQKRLHYSRIYANS